MKYTTGIIFDIKEFAIYDGPGLRCTVFFKGCPMRCSWCHNPEGIEPFPQIMRTSVSIADGSSDDSERTVGQVWESSALAEKLLGYAPLFNGTEGGITFSGGEPLMQAHFVRELVALLDGKMHILLQTSGYASEDEFIKTTDMVDLVYFDIKLADSATHEKYTGKDNRLILNNLYALNASGKQYRLRFPLIPSVTDTEVNYRGILKIVENLAGNKNFLGIDLLPYNPIAGGKHQSLGMEYNPGFDENLPLNVQPDFFSDITEAKVA